MKELTTGQVARKAGVNVETVRYYERFGLLPKPPRRTSGYRQYSDEALRRLRFIRHAKELGFSLKEISELLALRFDPESPCSEVKRRSEAKLKHIREKINTLKRMEKVLARLAAACKGMGPTSECPILDALEADEEKI